MTDDHGQQSQPRLSDDVIKEYSTKDLKVYWNPKSCAHPGFCWKGLPSVFNPHKRPWIDLNAASPEEIIKTIDACPTGALMYDIPEGSNIDPEKAHGPGWVNYKKENPPTTRINIVKNGPIMLEGLSEVYDSQGTLIKKHHQLALCRCGLSGNKPFCDGAHYREAWKE